jgi:Kef-type K+ transport system membrane component KefB
MLIVLLVGLLLVPTVFATTNGESSSAHGSVVTLLWIAVLLFAAKLSSLVEKIGQPSVLGELVVGVVLGNLGLVGFHFLEDIKTDPYIMFMAGLGVIILLFQVGLESNIRQMMKVGLRALLVAIVGVVVPFVAGTYVIGPWLLPGLSANAYLFLGAALTATSVGITARVFRDLGKLQIREAQIVLGAAVIDDVIGLIILAVVSAIVTTGAVSGVGVMVIFGKAVGFLVGAIIIGQLLAPRLGHVFSKINTGVGMKLALAMIFAFVFAYVAGQIGLAPIVGAFAAGLVLDPVHFKSFKKPHIVQELEEHSASMETIHKDKVLRVAERHAEKHVDDLIEPIGHFLVPIFFVYTGMGVKLETLLNPSVLLVALGVTIVAFVGKIVAGLVAGNVNKWLVGWGMVPRGEVGLIFATIGKSLGVVSDELFSVIVIMIILSTLLTPPILSHILKRVPVNA